MATQTRQRTKTPATKTTNSNNLIIKVKKLDPRATIPAQMTEGSACFDVSTIEDVYIRTLNASDKADIIHTGLAFEIPDGYHMKVFLRSSIGLNTKLRLANQVGIIDSDYRGELMLIVENPSRNIVKIPKGTRVAQCLIEKNVPIEFVEADSLSKTARGTKGIGSTGKGSED